ncbi:MAG: hypothetical protein OEW75_12770 [Cyclobacteriaceae bacterium]|nr:hypothetical protein [Cyclobacteriaceae bacterium]
MRKYFQQDKNYILYGAQFDKEEELLQYLVEYSKTYYQQKYNPLGLIDDTILKIKDHENQDTDVHMFSEFYELISAVYRFRHGNNQLEFLFDGMDHYTKYSIDWDSAFKEWIVKLFNTEAFLKTVLQLTVFNAQGHSKNLALNRMNTYMFQHFNLKVYKYKGIVLKKAA